MKSSILIAICSFLTMQSFSQCHCDCRISDSKFITTLVGKGDVYELFGVGAQFQLRNRYRPRYTNPFAGIEVNEKSVGGQLGLKFNLIPNSLSTCFKFHFITSLSYLYRLDVVITHDELVYDTFQNQRKMIGAFRIGPSIEYGRFNLYATFHPGISWDPKLPYEWKQNMWWYMGGEIGIGIHLFSD